MSSIFNEVFGGKDTSKLTPIEIALGIDENGMTTARKLYDFLGMDRSNYSRWVKSNIVENQFAEENVDFWAIVTDDERSFNPNPTQDYKITAHFAKKLSMIVKNEKGEEARKYFVQIEDGAKKMVDMIRDTADYHIDAATLKGIASTENLIRSTMRD